MRPEIGSNFWIAPEDLETEDRTCTPGIFGLSGSDSVWLSTGRSAIAFVLEEARHRDPGLGWTALIPPFTCHTVIEPFLKAGYTVRTYSVDEELRTSGGELLRAVEESGASVVLVHRYFGFDTLSGSGEAVETLRRKGVVIIEDRTQCLYSAFAPLPADYLVGSIRKWTGMPDGGFAVCREGIFPMEPAEADRALETAKIAAGIAKYRYLFERTGEKTVFLKMFQEAEELLDRQEGYRAIAGVSLRMQAALNAEALRRKRRENFRTLLKGLVGCPGIRLLFLELPEDVVPLYFPVWVEGDRGVVQAGLREASIYAPIIWPRSEELPPACREAEGFYEHLLCLPIDQRYDRDDMERMVERICLMMKKIEQPPDIYYLPEWRKLYARRDGAASECFTFRHPDGTVLYPYVLRKTPDTGDEIDWYDIITPYGFNGPCVVDRRTEDFTALREAFDRAFDAHCQEKHIIAEYVRFSPWLKNAEVFGPLYALRDNGLTVAIDLTVDDILRDECSSKRRNLIRAAQKKGVVVEFDETGETIGIFCALYKNTVEKNNIGAYYQFPQSFLEEHFHALGNHVCVANAKVNGRVISSSFLLCYGEHMHYHLSANDYDMTTYQGNSLLLYEAARRGKAFGCKYLHLGGVGTAEPTLLHFKLSFTRRGGMLFLVGSRVRNQEIFDQLSKKYGKEDSSYFPPYRG